MNGWVESFNQRVYLVWYAEPPLSPEDIETRLRKCRKRILSLLYVRRPCVSRLHVNVCESEVYITIDRPAIKASKKPLNDK